MKPAETILNLLNTARAQFVEQDDKLNNLPNSLKIFKQNIDKNVYCVFGVERSSQNKELIRSIRNIVLKEMNLSLDTTIIQVIGDSNSFQDDRVNLAKSFLYNFLDKDPKTLILYGMTGQCNKNAHKYDANGLVSAWIDEDPNNRSRRVLGNAVDYHTPLAIQQWGCNIGDLRTIFLVYTRGTADAKFGDDVISSDYIVKNHMDTISKDFCICLEGGIQSFNQIVTMLNDGVKVIALKGIRGDQNPACYDQQKAQYIPYFSAAEFLSIIKEKYFKKSNLVADDINEALTNYIYNPLKDGEYNPASLKRVYANPSKPDYSTKAALMEAAWREFIAQKTWKKLDKLTVVDYSELTVNLSNNSQESCTDKYNDNVDATLIGKFSAIYRPADISKNDSENESTMGKNSTSVFKSAKL